MLADAKLCKPQPARLEVQCRGASLDGGGPSALRCDCRQFNRSDLGKEDLRALLSYPCFSLGEILTIKVSVHEAILSHGFLFLHRDIKMHYLV